MPVVKDKADLDFLASSHPHLYRSDSLRSSGDDRGSVVSSESKRVSFNNDVRIKRIPNKKPSPPSGLSQESKFASFVREAVNPDKAEAETAAILQQLEGIECSASPINTLEAKKDNRLYGLHALNNLDIAVNGKEVNSMPSYHEIRKQRESSPKKPPRMTHYAQPALVHSDLESVMSSDLRYKKRLMEAEDSAIASGGDADDSTVTSSYTNSRFVMKPASRNCLTDTEILRSPSEVLYAVSDKHKHHNNELTTNAASQTTRYVSRPRSAYNYSSSREDLASNGDLRYRPSHGKNASRSLDRGLYEDNNKENSFKTRIQVISPDRQHMIQNGNKSDYVSRKPYKTMINTATDNILYRGNSTDNLSYYHYGENTHYKVPRNKPLLVMRNNDYTYSRNSLQRPQQPPQQQFASTRLVRNIESNRGVNPRYRNRNYSGHSTSPDREVSPERSYRHRPHQQQQQQPPQVRSSSYIQHRSPSSSPTRPPRSRASPTRESVVRRQNSIAASEAARSARRGSYQPESDRLSRFIEYRGEDIIMPHAQDPNQQARRPASVERGQSLPPGATIESTRDFYKSSQYKSMHALPPSPTRPAPVLDRGQPRPRMAVSAGPRVSISEGDNTDDGGGRPPEKMPRHHHRPRAPTSTLRPVKRQAPSPPPAAASTGKGLVVRRVVSSDGRRPLVSPNVQNVPTVRRMVVGGGRRSSTDNGLDSSFSESEGFTTTGEAEQPRPWSSLSDDDDLDDEIEYVLAVTNGLMNGSRFDLNYNNERPRSRISSAATIVHVHANSQPIEKNVVFHENPTSYHTIIKDKQPLGDFGRRWTAAASDIDSDYRRELATNPSGFHQEARSRDGGLGGRLSRGSSKNNLPAELSNNNNGLERSNSSSAQAREEERRKVLEIEGVMRRSTSRAGRTAHVTNAGPRGYKPVVSRHVDLESQYSGHSSSQTAPPAPVSSVTTSAAPVKLNRFDQHRVGRVRRSTSNANAAAAMGGVRREINQRKIKLPGGSLTSSINSSESEQGSHAGQSAISRATSNRSVFLHAAAVADIPTTLDAPPPSRPLQPQQPQRSLSAESRDNRSVVTSPAGPPSSNLKGSKKISRSISLLAPWKPRPVQDKFEIHYDNGNLYANPATRVTVEPGNLPPPSSKPPRPPTAPPPPPSGPPPVRRNTKMSASSTDLLRPLDSTPAVILAERKAEAARKAKVSRSMSMPKDSRLAGWFKKRKRIV